MSTARDANVIMVQSRSASATRGWLTYGNLRFPCALGRRGRRTIKRETDGASPIGKWPLRKIYYRRDRLKRPFTALPLQSLRREDGWCDAPRDRNYNRHVNHPYHASAEHLWRQDDLYDIIVILGHNDLPRIKGMGSAIFLHVAGNGYQPTEGCISLKKAHLIRLLTQLKCGVFLQISS